MNKIFKIAISIYVSVMLVISTSIISFAVEDPKLTYREDFRWGMNIHHDFYNVYGSSNIEDIMHLMAEMGVRLVRTGFGSLDWTDKVVRLANKYGMQVMIINGSVRSSQEGYDADSAFRTAAMIANRYNGKNGYGKVDYFQIDNEVDNYLIELAHEKGIELGDGSNKDKYPIDDVTRVCFQFNNYAAGIRSADTDAKIVINSGWLHYGFHDWLEEFKVDYDIIGFDWYTDMSEHFERDGKRPVEQVEFLYNRYGKEIIICETNNWNNNGRDDSDVSNWDSFIRLLDDAYKYPYVLGSCVYEFCDEMYLQNDENVYNREAHFGMVYADKYGNLLEPKPIYYRLQNLWGGKKVEKLLYSEVLKEYQNSNSNSNNSSVESSTNNNSSSATDDNSIPKEENITSDSSNINSEVTSGSVSSDESLLETDNSTDNTITQEETINNADKSVSKFEWTFQNTLAVICGVVFVLLIAGCIAFILIRNKQIKLLLNK